MKTKSDCIACLRRTANALEVTVEWLRWDCIHVLGATGRFGDESGYTKDDYVGMELSMVDEALDSLVWWLRKAAEEWEGNGEPAGDRG